MLLAMVNDIRVILIKLADRLHNMRTLEAPAGRTPAAGRQETMEIYAPIAHRLGMGKIRAELEDLSFRYLDPIGYDQVRESHGISAANRRSIPGQVIKILEQKLRGERRDARVEGRIKRLYVFTETEAAEDRPGSGLRSAGRAHHHRFGQELLRRAGRDPQEWHPIPGRIKDFIAMPRPNLYQSLHTTVIRKTATIRSADPHRRNAPDGGRRHRRALEIQRGRRCSAEDDQRIAWLRQLVEWQREMHDPGEFLSTLKVDLYPEEVYTFTPKGSRDPAARCDADRFRLRHPLRCRQYLHRRQSQRPHRAVAYKLRNGDVVEIMTQPGHNPSKDWLGFVKTSRARNKIRHWLNIHQRERAIEIGKKLMEKQARKYRLAMKDFKDKDLETIAKEYGLGSAQDLMAGIGYGKFSARQVLAKLSPGISEETARNRRCAESRQQDWHGDPACFWPERGYRRD